MALFFAALYRRVSAMYRELGSKLIAAHSESKLVQMVQAGTISMADVVVETPEEAAQAEAERIVPHFAVLMYTDDMAF